MKPFANTTETVPRLLQQPRWVLNHALWALHLRLRSKITETSQLTLAQMDVIELNEAFAAQAFACTRDLVWQMMMHV
jgi:acetyl-CoA acetyltransferase